ncbi:hypothetical protein OKW98_26760 [Pseudomonas sp. KU26590]|uniref:hypothetical protein n=1 Tax=Pseudomonas sp. KU26590 TaxID=2991051 RepID=UPI00223CF6A6|nr:hypothetical protein [Pseudomonas sp. KU26590]UZJ60073.1 hypothetical protein OKW98_26760 [Pseudomonas sp. KU26590]
MSYIGVDLEVCRVIPFNWNNTSLVVVSGDGPTVCGHALIKDGFYYFHMAGLASGPYVMPEQGYRRYLNESGKTELFRRPVYLPDPEGAQRKLNELSVNLWYCFGIPKNCVSFVEELFLAGGADESILSNSPVPWR